MINDAIHNYSAARAAGVELACDLDQHGIQFLELLTNADLWVLSQGFAEALQLKIVDRYIRPYYDTSQGWAAALKSARSAMVEAASQMSPPTTAPAFVAIDGGVPTTAGTVRIGSLMGHILGEFFAWDFDVDLTDRLTEIVPKAASSVWLNNCPCCASQAPWYLSLYCALAKKNASTERAYTDAEHAAFRSATNGKMLPLYMYEIKDMPFYHSDRMFECTFGKHESREERAFGS